MIRKIALGLFTALIVSLHAAGQNKLLDRNFWKSNPSIERIKSLVAEGNDPSDLNRYSFDALSWALLEKADSNILEYLLSQNGNSVNKLTHDGRTYIFWAAYSDNLSFMKSLHAKGADMSIVDEHGYSLLTFTAVTGNKNQDIYNFIIDKGAKPKTETNRDGANSLLLLLPFLNSNEMINYFNLHGLDLGDTDQHGATAAHYASKGGNTELLKSLKTKGVDYKGIDNKGRTTAHYAAMSIRGKKTNPKILEFLKEEGVNLWAKAKNGQSALGILAQGNADSTSIHYLIENGCNVFDLPETGRSAFMSLTTKWKVKQLSKFEPTKDIINCQNNKGETAVLLAAKHNSPEVLRYLFETGGDPHVTDKKNKPIQEYVLEGYRTVSVADFTEKVSLLKEVNLDFNTPLSGENTIFHWVVKKAKLELLDILTPITDNIDVLNQDGLTALHLAAMTASSIDPVKKLLSLGASKDITTSFDETPLELALQNEKLKGFEDFLKELL